MLASLVVAEPLPDTEIITGDGRIARAWLTRPTDIYQHGVLGDRIEAGGVAVRLDTGEMRELVLPPGSVFEDRVPRLVGLDNKGRTGIILVRSYLDQGAALCLIELGEAGLVVSAQAEPIGTAHRWLNPVGAGDFDGDGRMEFAAVITPHIGGTLKLYEKRGDRLVEEHSVFGFSNHRMGSRNLGLATTKDLDADGVDELIVPSADRRRLRVVSFADSRFRSLGELSLPAAVNGNLAWESGFLKIPLSNGMVVRIKRASILTPPKMLD